MTTIVKVACDTSSQLHPVIIPLISYAIIGTDSPGTMDPNFLLKEGIALWLAIIRTFTGAYSVDLDSCLRGCLSALVGINGDGSVTEGLLGDLDDDGVKDVCMVIEAYALVGSSECLRSCSELLKLLYHRLLGQVQPRIVPYLLRPIDAFLLSCPGEAMSFLYQSGVLSRMLQGCCAHIPGLNVVMQDFMEPEVALVGYLSVLARVILLDNMAFLQLCSTLLQDISRISGGMVNGTAEELVSGVVVLMLEQSDHVSCLAGGQWRRKLWVLSLASLVSMQNSTLLSHFPELLMFADGVICENSSDTNQTVLGLDLASSMVCMSTEDMSFMRDGDGNVSLGGTVESIAIRMNQLIEQDRVVRTDLRQAVRDCVIALQHINDKDTVNTLLQSLPSITLSRLLN